MSQPRTELPTPRSSTAKTFTNGYRPQRDILHPSMALSPRSRVALSPQRTAIAWVPMSSTVQSTSAQSRQPLPITTASLRRLRKVQFLKTTFVQFSMTTAMPELSSKTMFLNSTS